MTAVPRASTIAQKLGAALKTPAYIYDVSEIDRRVAALSTAMGGPIVLSYKAISSVDVLARVARDHLAGVEVASRGELRALAGHPLPLFINTPAMTPELMGAALGARAHLVLDSLGQVEMLRRLDRPRHPQPVFLRLNAAVLGRFAENSTHLRPDHFGMDWDEFIIAVNVLREVAIPIGGLHLFAGSYSFAKLAPHLVTALSPLLADLHQRTGIAFPVVNLGGGLGEAWETEAIDFAAYRTSLNHLPGSPAVLHEFGRAAFSTGGSFVTRVLAVKEIQGRRYAVCDGGLAQAFLLAGTEHAFRKPRAAVLSAADGGARDTVDIPVGIVGSSCSRDDVIGTLTVAPLAGDLVVFPGCGAYHRTYAMPHFLSLGEATVYVA